MYSGVNTGSVKLTLWEFSKIFYQIIMVFYLVYTLQVCMYVSMFLYIFVYLSSSIRRLNFQRIILFRFPVRSDDQLDLNNNNNVPLIKLSENKLQKRKLYKSIKSIWTSKEEIINSNNKKIRFVKDTTCPYAK